MTTRPASDPRFPALQVCVAVFAALFFCGSCNSCDQPAPEPPGGAPIAAATTTP